MLGAIAGDIFGAAYEGNPIKRDDFDLFDAPRNFTDDTVLTVATADALLSDGDYAAAYRRWGNRFPGRGYGGWFLNWLGDPSLGPYNSFDVTCQGSVPEALIAFLDADDFEHTLRLAISLGADSDTQAAIAGGVAEAFWGGLPERIEAEVRDVLDPALLEVVDRFSAKARG
jgi:ADP-ribosylglycohydrolase